MGLLVAAIDWDYDRLGTIVQYGVSGSGSTYTLSDPYYARTGELNMRTARPFDLARNSTGDLLMAWQYLDGSCSTMRGNLASATKATLDHTVAFQPATVSGRCTYGGVDVSNDRGT